MSARGEALVELLFGVDESLHPKYVRAIDAGNEHTSLKSSVAESHLQSKKYVQRESFVDDFMKHLLNDMGFNNGRLCVARQMVDYVLAFSSLPFGPFLGMMTSCLVEIISLTRVVLP